MRERGEIVVGIYLIRLEGHLDVVWSEWLSDLDMTHLEDGTTLLSGPLLDQSALHGVLSRLRDLCIPLLFVIKIDPEDPAYHCLRHYQLAFSRKGKS